MTDDQIIALLEYLIFEKKKTQSEVADDIGINRRVIWNLLSRKQSIKGITRMKFERYAKKIDYK